MASSPARLAAAFRMLSPVSTSRWALCTRRSRMASAMVGLGNQLVPVLDGELAGHNRRAASMAVVDDLQEIAGLILGDGGEPPVVEDQQIDARQALQQTRVTSVAARERKRIEQPGHAMIEHGAIVPARLVAEGAGEPTLSKSGFPDDRQVLVSRDPVASVCRMALDSMSASSSLRSSQLSMSTRHSVSSIESLAWRARSLHGVLIGGQLGLFRNIDFWLFPLPIGLCR